MGPPFPDGINWRRSSGASTDERIFLSSNPMQDVPGCCFASRDPRVVAHPPHNQRLIGRLRSRGRPHEHVCSVQTEFAWKRVFPLGLLLQSGTPFDRSSKSWFVLVRIVGPDRSGTWPHRRASGIVVKCGGCLAHPCVAPQMIDSTASPPFEYWRPPYLRSVNSEA